MIHVYLNKVFNTVKTVEYAIKYVYSDIRKCNLLDIGLMMHNLAFVTKKENQEKVIKKVENHILLTHEEILRGRNLQGIIYFI